MTAQTVAGVLISLALVVCVVILIRNERVYRHRLRVLSRLDMLAKADIEAGRGDWHRWLDLFEQTSYDEQVIKFWRRLDGFYPPELRP